MKSLHIPHFKGNHYQRLLSEALSEQGVDVELEPYGGVFSVSRSLRARPGTDILHIHWTHPFIEGRNGFTARLKSRSFLAQCRRALARGVKLVWTVHNIGEHGGRFPKLDAVVHRQLASLCHGIIVHGKTARREVGEAFGIEGDERIRVIPHANYIGVYPDTMGRKEARKALGMGKGKRLLLYFGFIRDYKGLPELIDSFKKLDAKDARLVIAGKPFDDGLVAKLRKKAEGDRNIRLDMEYIPDERVQEYMKAADAVVLPYRDFLTSGAVMLAMSFGRPVIAPDAGHIREVVEDRGGFLYDPADPKGLLRSMKELTTAEPEVLGKMGALNLKAAKSHSWKKAARATVRLYRDCQDKGD